MYWHIRAFSSSAAWHEDGPLLNVRPPPQFRPPPIGEMYRQAVRFNVDNSGTTAPYPVRNQPGVQPQHHSDARRDLCSATHRTTPALTKQPAHRLLCASTFAHEGPGIHIRGGGVRGSGCGHPDAARTQARPSVRSGRPGPPHLPGRAVSSRWRRSSATPLLGYGILPCEEGMFPSEKLYASLPSQPAR